MHSLLRALNTNMTLAAFCFLAALVPMTAFVSARAIVPLTLLAVLTGLVDQLRRRELRLRVDFKAVVILALVGLWALTSSIWALDPFLALRGSGKLFGTFLIGILLLGMALNLREKCPPKLPGYALTAGMVITLGALTIDGLFENPISGLMYNGIVANVTGHYWLNASSAILILLVWPLMAFLKAENKTIWGIVILVWLTWVTYLIGFTTGLVVIGIAAALYLPFLMLKQKAFIVLSVLIAAVVLTSPFLIPRVFDPSVYAPIKAAPKPAVHRMYIWKFASDRILEKPIAGWGMNAARSIPGGKVRVEDEFRDPYGEYMPLHPHNAGLQIWLELGLPGALAFAALLAIILARAPALGLTNMMSSLLLLQFMSAFLFSEASFGIWQSWWQTTLWINISFAVLLFRPPGIDNSSGPSRYLEESSGGGGPGRRQPL